jgi:hypothetical protein
MGKLRIISRADAKARGLSHPIIGKTPMTEPWCRRPKAPRGDSSPDSIFCGVGRALTMWEIIEYHISIAYIGLIHLEQYPDDKYFALSSFAQRHKLVQKAIEANVNGKIAAASASSWIWF